MDCLLHNLFFSAQGWIYILGPAFEILTCFKKLLISKTWKPTLNQFCVFYFPRNHTHFVYYLSNLKHSVKNKTELEEDIIKILNLFSSSSGEIHSFTLIQKKSTMIQRYKKKKTEGFIHLFQIHTKISAIHLYFQSDFALWSQNIKIYDSIRILDI